MMPLLRPLAAAGPAGCGSVLGYWLGGLLPGDQPAPMPTPPAGTYWHPHFWAAPSSEPKGDPR
jgi:hypothetical protein